MLKKKKKKNGRNTERKKEGREGGREELREEKRKNEKEEEVEENEKRGGEGREVRAISWIAEGTGACAAGGIDPAPLGTCPRLHANSRRGGRGRQSSRCALRSSHSLSPKLPPFHLREPPPRLGAPAAPSLPANRSVAAAAGRVALPLRGPPSDPGRVCAPRTCARVSEPRPGRLTFEPQTKRAGGPGYGGGQGDPSPAALLPGYLLLSFP